MSTTTIMTDDAEIEEDAAESPLPSDRCPRCGGEAEAAFGLAGGGFGPYLICLGDCGVFSKTAEK